MFLVCGILIEILLWRANAGSVIAGLQIVPPAGKYGVNHEAFDKKTVDATFGRLPEDEDEDGGNIWEKSGLYEGDIMYYSESKNGIIDKANHWTNATIPFYIEEEDFSDKEIKIILSALREFHKKTCLRFRPYRESDENWVFVTGSEGGCWSSVGMRNEGGQQLNVNSPNCVREGVVMHEFLHAAGFYHQQSASNRDDYVKIIWENISPGKESNFNKYNASYVSDYGTTYDYTSIMHYSSTAFSKNKNATIVALQNITQLGQREGFSNDDIVKLNRMYDFNCHPPESEEESHAYNIIEWFRMLLRS